MFRFVWLARSLFQLLIPAGKQSHTLICGANSTEELVAKGQNENCRAFAIKDHKSVTVSSGVSLVLTYHQVELSSKERDSGIR